jgi:hypothetical protein
MASGNKYIEKNNNDQVQLPIRDCVYLGSFVELCATEVVVSRGLQTVIFEMRNGTKLRTIGSAKNATQLSRRRRARKTNAAPKTLNAPKIIEFIAPKTELPVVKAPPSQIGFPLPFLFWPAFPIAMMHMWLGPRNTGVRN